MSTSIPVVNRNQTLPPLLLPDLRFLNERQYQKISAGVAPMATREGTLKRFSTLESLASVATKRLKLGAEAGAQASTGQIMTPPPTAPVSASISPSPSYAAFQESPRSAAKSTSPAPVAGRAERAGRGALNTAKRQRIGPSCDGCRLKKIKCDASIEILLQDEVVVPLVSSKLHHVLTRGEIAEHSAALLKNLGLPECLLNDQSTEGETEAQEQQVIKHIDKIVLFKPCGSCRKRRSSNGSYHDCCVFSKGFTRADINVFSKIAARVPGKAVSEMDVDDYRNAGF